MTLKIAQFRDASPVPEESTKLTREKTYWPFLNEFKIYVKSLSQVVVTVMVPPPSTILFFTVAPICNRTWKEPRSIIRWCWYAVPTNASSTNLPHSSSPTASNSSSARSPGSKTEHTPQNPNKTWPWKLWEICEDSAPNYRLLLVTKNQGRNSPNRKPEWARPPNPPTDRREDWPEHEFWEWIGQIIILKYVKIKTRVSFSNLNPVSNEGSPSWPQCTE